MYRINFSYKEYLTVICGNLRKRYRIFNERIDICINNIGCSIFKDGNDWKCDYNKKIFCINLNQEYTFDNVKLFICNNDKKIEKANSIGLRIVFILLSPIIVFSSVRPAYCSTITDSQETSENHRIETMTSFDNEVITIVSANGQYNVENLAEESIVLISKEMQLTDSKNRTFSADELVGEKICMSYKGKENEDCIFVGRFDRNFRWDGECQICAYKDGALYYCTTNIYKDGHIASFNRLSRNIKSNRWIYTEKLVLENGLEKGDTWSYAFKVLKAKKYNMSLPEHDSMYTLDEARGILEGAIINHYYGEYDENGDWTDLSGEAYNVKYDNGKFVSVFKGQFVKNHYIEGWMLGCTENNEYFITQGQFRDINTNPIIGNSTTDVISKEEIKAYLSGELFEKEVTDCL